MQIRHVNGKGQCYPSWFEFQNTNISSFKAERVTSKTRDAIWLAGDGTGQRSFFKEEKHEIKNIKDKE